MYAKAIEKIYECNWNKLIDLNVCFIKLIMDFLGLKKDLYISSELNIEGKGSELVLNICKRFSTDKYLSGIHGRDYLDKNLFKANQIKIFFQDLKPPKIDFETTETPNFELSIIDLLFKFGEKSLDVLMSGGGVYNDNWQ